MARYGEPRGNEYGSDDNRERWRDDDRERSSWRGSQGTGERDDERGFFERAGDEIRSWFSDDDDRGPDYNRGQSGSGWSGQSSWDRENRDGISDRDRERSFGRIGRGGSDYMNQDRGSSGGVGQSGRSSWDRDQGRGGYGPSRGGGYWTGSSNRDRESRGAYGENRGGFGGFRDESDFRGQHGRDHPQSNRGSSPDRDRGFSDPHLGYGDFSGTLGGFGNQRFGSNQDDHYRSWRDRQMSQLDRDYGDYCREREQQFHSDFDTWRRNRQGQQGENRDQTMGQGSSDELVLGGSSASQASPGKPGESSAIGGGSLTSGSPTQTDAGTETTGAGSGVSGRSRNRS